MKNNFTTIFTENFTNAYTTLFNLHPQTGNESFNLRYLRVDWFFPQHIHNVLEQIVEVNKTYFDNKANLEICLFAGLFHDAGLVYKRESASPKGHENRSVEYAELELVRLGYDHNFIEKVSECIKSTELDYISELPEALVVRNADAYAHIISMHFFAKSNFSNDIKSFVKWFNDKLDITARKITIKELEQSILALMDSYKKMIVNYHTHDTDKVTFIDKLLNY